MLLLVITNVFPQILPTGTINFRPGDDAGTN